jgi:hypothetical protein
MTNRLLFHSMTGLTLIVELPAEVLSSPFSTALAKLSEPQRARHRNANGRPLFATTLSSLIELGENAGNRIGRQTHGGTLSLGG